MADSGKTRADGSPGLTIPFAEFVLLSALLTALTALSIDIMLPALPNIASEFNRTASNDRQLVVIVYFIGFGGGQLFWGPFSDRFGRIPVLAVGLGIFVLGAILALMADSFEALLTARIVQGLGSAASRVTVTAIARDLFSGARMSRVMSLIMTVFIAVPILAPLAGQGLLFFGTWRLHFYVILAIGLIALSWAMVRLPETRPRAARQGAKNRFQQALLGFMRERAAIAYMVASGLIFGCLTAYIANAQQIFGELYALGDSFAIAFSSISAAVAVASFTNARIVMSRGMRRVCHVALVGFVILSALLAVAAYVSPPSLPVLIVWLGLLFFLFGLIGPNFNAIALEPMGAIAGLAASIFGFANTSIAALGGWLIGGSYDGTLFPFALGFTLLSSFALLLIFLVEGRAGMFGGRDPRR